MKSKIIYLIAIFILAMSTGCDSKDELIDDQIKDSSLINRNQDFLGRVYMYAPNGVNTHNFAKFEIQFYASDILCIREYREGSWWPFSEQCYSYNIDKNVIYVQEGEEIEILSEECLQRRGNLYNVTSTNGEYQFVPMDDDNNNNDNKNNEDNKTNVKITISPISDSAEINFVISVKGTEVKPTYVKVEYVVSPVKMDNPILSNSRDARWVDHPISTTWNYMSYVLGPKHSYVYYRVKALVNGKIITTDINYGVLVNT